jgi:hypothetical protein
MKLLLSLTCEAMDSPDAPASQLIYETIDTEDYEVTIRAGRDAAQRYTDNDMLFGYDREAAYAETVAGAMGFISYAADDLLDSIDKWTWRVSKVDEYTYKTTLALYADPF